MKKIALLFLLAAMGFAVNAQYDKVKTTFLLKKYEDAKTELDKVLANPKLKDKDKVEGTYWTFAIYGSFYGDEALSAKYPGADSIALLALADYEQKDTSLKALRENYSMAPVIETIRATGFNTGVKNFNAKQPQAAYKGFNAALKADDFMVKHGMLAKNFIDTTIVLYAGYAAQNSGDLANAVAHYKILVDNKIVIDNKDFDNGIFNVMLTYYIRNNDQANFTKYAAAIKTLVPAFAPKIDQLSMANMTSNTSLADLVAKYKAEAATASETQLVAYAEAFAQPDKDELAKLDSAKQVDLKLTAAEAFSKAFAVAPKSGGVQETTIGKNGTQTAEDNTGLYAYNAGILYYNIYQDLDQRFYDLRGESPALKAKRDAVEKLEGPYADSAAVWFTNAYNIFKVKTELSKREKNLMLNTVKDLANIYQWKENKARGVNPKEYDKWDALYKQFDAETDKYSK